MRLGALAVAGRELRYKVEGEFFEPGANPSVG